jgi:hypothetical protein
MTRHGKERKRERTKRGRVRGSQGLLKRTKQKTAPTNAEQADLAAIARLLVFVLRNQYVKGMLRQMVRDRATCKAKAVDG